MENYRRQPKMTRRISTLSEGERFWSCLSMFELVESGNSTSISEPHSNSDEEVAAEIGNREVFTSLQLHPNWGAFFRTFGYDLGIGCVSSGSLEVGEKFAEGAQAELFHAHVNWRDPKMKEDDLNYGREWVLKVFEKGTFLRHLRAHLPHGYLQIQAEEYERTKLGKPLSTKHIVNILCGTLLEDGRFAFLMQKVHNNLRSLIDYNMHLKTNEDCGPFPKEVAEGIMYHVALGMDWLHNHDIVHRDLKASNVLVNSKNGNCKSFVSDFDISIGGTGFFRAPEILQAREDKSMHRRPELYSKQADVYSYGMTCYEILTGKVPFEVHFMSDFDFVLEGQRPEVPKYVDDWVRELLTRCWQSNPVDRPSFREILNILLANSAAVRDKHLLEQQSEIADVKASTKKSLSSLPRLRGSIRKVKPRTPAIAKSAFKEHWDIRNNSQEIAKKRRQRVEEDFSSLKLMESVEPISELSEALRIIEDVTETSGNFLMNRHQCERLANRLYAIGVQLERLPKEFIGSKSLDADNNFDYAPFYVLLKALGKAKALISKYTGSNESTPGVLTRTENRREPKKAFEEIHTWLDVMNSLFHSGDFESTSETRSNAMLRRDADMDLKELFESLHELARNDEGRQSAFNVMVLELKSSPPSLLHKPTQLLESLVTHMLERTESGKSTSIEEQIERSMSPWSQELIEFGSDEDEVAEVSNVGVFKTLQSHPTWGGFFMMFGEGELVMGEKFVEGRLTEFYEAQVNWRNQFRREDMLKYGWESEWVLKVYSKINLRDLQCQFSFGFFESYAERINPEWKKPRHVRNILCGMLLKSGRFAFLMQRGQENLRTVVERNMTLKTDLDHGPFSKEVAEGIMYHVALGMNWLHQRNVLHRDLKAANVLLNEDKDGNYQCLVCDYECSAGVMGTGFWRAPEVLQACKNKDSSRLEVFTNAGDAYSYGMTCYEILPGKIPFEEHGLCNYDLVLRGQRPHVPKYVDVWAHELLHRCWQSNPADRPSFVEILNILSANPAAR